jgi:hypothetical protein
MTKGILVVGDKDGKLMKNILSFYESKNRYVENITPSNIETLNPSSKSCNIYVTTKDITFNKTEQELLHEFFTKSEHNRVLLTSVTMPSINTKAIKGLYDNYFIPHKNLRSGLMALRLKFVLGDHYPELTSYISFITNTDSNMFLHIKFLNDTITLNTIDLNEYKYTDEFANIVAVFDEGDDTSDNDEHIVKVIL